MTPFDSFFLNSSKDIRGRHCNMQNVVKLSHTNSYIQLAENTKSIQGVIKISLSSNKKQKLI